MSKWSLFLDDLRSPIDVMSGAAIKHHNIEIARSSLEAKLLVVDLGMPAKIWFDHDLGGDDTAMRFIHWLISADMEDNFIKTPFEYEVHSANPVGVDNIVGLIKSYFHFKFDSLG